METEADDKDAAVSADNVTAYLQHMLCAARTLTATAKSEDVRMQDPLEEATSTDHLLDSIASTLLEVVAVLHHPIDGLVPQPPAPVQHEWDPLDADLLTRPYPMRRTDYLRRLLRALAPVAMEIAARVLDSSSSSYRECATILFGFWLPIAPQLLPGFMDGVEQGRLPFLFHEQEQQDDTLLIRLEATYHIARECWYTHRQPVSAMAWSEWHRVALFQEQYPWFARRILAYVTHNFDNHAFLAKIPGVATPIPYNHTMLHPTDLHAEAMEYSQLLVEHMTRVFWNETPIASPAPAEVYALLSRPHPRLCQLQGDYSFWKHQTTTTTQATPSIFVPTPTSADNLHQLAQALALDDCRPILLQGGGGASVVRHAAQSLHVPSLLELYLDETTDAATLLGTMTIADGEQEQKFQWQPGAITKAALAGHWLLLHHLETVVDVQAILEPLFQDGMVPPTTAHGRPQRVHRNFRCFAFVQQPTKVLNPQYFVALQMQPVPREELMSMAQALLAPRGVVLPTLVLEAAQQILRHTSTDGNNVTRPFLKLVQRLASVVGTTTASTTVSHQSQYCTEHDRLCCLADAVDCWVQRWSDPQARQAWIATVAAPAFQVHPTTAVQFVLHRPTVERVPNWLSLITTNIGNGDVTSSFAYTPSTIRLLESLAVAVRHNEPVLLVGETGTGKTTVIQQLARLVPQTNNTQPIELVVQNVSLQTDATDLLGGYRPLELQQVARTVYHMFVDVFTGTFSRQQNAAFLQFAATAYQQQQWKRLSGCFRKAATLGLQKVDQRHAVDESNAPDPSAVSAAAWDAFRTAANRFERQRTTSGPLFAFTEGALVDAMRTGKWVLLDEINLASSETLQRLTGLLGNDSLTLTERGDVVALERHPSFRLFAAMNPATDAGKKELARGLRNKFTELHVDELLDPAELRQVVARYISPISASNNSKEDHTVQLVVELYLKFRAMADESFVDGSGQRPRYTLRTLTRTVTAACQLVAEQNYPIFRALYESFQLTFQGSLESKSYDAFAKVLRKKLGKHVDLAQCEKPCRRPGGRQGADNFHLVQPFWIGTGPNPSQDWANGNESRSRFVLVPGTLLNLRRLARAVASGPWPVLLEGPTSAGKTTLVEYMAARCGHTVVRINNHEHTDVQEYTGGYAADANGSLVFQDGILVSALRVGHWVILDELNLAPSDVLEALNRLLDDNRELYIAETNETIRPHPNFRLFATQNPSGSYGGRKPLSRAFRNRFVEIQVNDINSEEMTTILVERCQCPPSHAQLLVDVMNSLRQKRSRSGVFLGSAGFITPRDLLRWAERGAATKRDLAREGYMLLAERLRSEDEKKAVQEEIERIFKLSIDIDDLYYNDRCLARTILRQIENRPDAGALSLVAPTKSLLRVITLVQHCINNKEPVLLVGETGCGKTMTVQLLSFIENARLDILNCHQTTETSDIIGGLRPVRGRQKYRKQLLELIGELNLRVEHLDILQLDVENLSDGEITTCMQMIRDSRERILHGREGMPEPSLKCRKLNSQFPATSLFPKMTTISLLDEIQDRYTKYLALFEWEDGPLVKAMKQGDNFLLDEMSLAEDAVLERLNSVLEHSRTIVLAEKPCSSEQSRTIVAQPAFQLFATMNPGGDFGKRELSPALRSRFTEIWVPPVKDMNDIGLVLKKSLAKIGDNWGVAERMLDYVAWFNNTISTDHSGMFAGLSLSLRDLLSWSSFICQSMQESSSFGLLDAYTHGAQLMHLDGLGLGTGLSLEQTASLVEKAQFFIRQQIEDGRGATTMDLSSEMNQSNDDFCIGHFAIPKGPKPAAADSSFCFGAPTPSTNVERILRALQLPKPVLLEGPPGCGKTSLIVSLASMVGHPLVRINLSEQTDMTDLIGSDIPVHNPSSSATTFSWADGALLAAIKAGSWVLLDELNLATQSVLEGLNSCLDHRAEVFIPELGETFACPTSFRVFAAQNPILQGGGRKGLPKSFLNRFTKVHIEALSDADFDQIVQSTFPELDDVGKAVEFNRLIHQTTIEDLSFAQEGAPFEFNLRDIFRWGHYGSSSLWRRASLLYVQRLRSQDDRDKARRVYESVFGQTELGDQEWTFSASNQCATVNKVKVKKIGNESSLNVPDVVVKPSLHEPLESAAACIDNNWPVLLVGNQRSNGPEIPRTLASLRDGCLIELSLCPATDVSELIGSFEQMDPVAQFRQLACDLVWKVEAALKECTTHQNEQSTIKVLEAFQKSCCQNTCLGAGVSKALAVISVVMKSCPQSMRPDFESFEGAFDALRGAMERQNSFRWKDGPLVEAMKQGHWLHLRNVNLCASSVLDRLNSVMEPDGCLLLTEAGVNPMQEGDDPLGSACSEIRCHPNFRIILSMDPKNGEVSRAMRNRCVEVFVLPEQQNPEKSLFDLVDQCSRQNLAPSYVNAVRAVTTNLHDETSLLAVQNTTMCQMAVSGSSARRGIPCATMPRSFCDVGHASEPSSRFSFLLPKPSVRDGWCAMPQFTRMGDKTRLLPLLEPLLEKQKRHSSLFDWVPHTNSDVVQSLPQLTRLPRDHFRNQLVSLVITELGEAERRDLLRFASSRRSSQFASLKLIDDYLQRIPALQRESKCFRSKTTQALHRHIAWDVYRARVTDRLQSPESLATLVTSDLSFLEASFRVSEGLSAHSLPNGSFLSLLTYAYPVLDELSGICEQLVERISVAEENNLVSSLLKLYEVIKDMWFALDGWKIGDGQKSGAVRAAILIQWRRCQISFRDLFKQLQCKPIECPVLRLRQVDGLFAASEQAIFGSKDEKLLVTSLQESFALPLVPQSAQGWTLSTDIRRIALSLCIERRHFSRKECWSLKTVLKDHDVGAFSTVELRNDIMCALSTLQLSGPKLQPTSNLEPLLPDLPRKLEQALRRHQHHLLSQIALFKPTEALEEPMDGIMGFTAGSPAATYDFEADFGTPQFQLLNHLANLQTSAAAEWWCEQNEAEIISLLSEFLLSRKSFAQLGRLKESINDLVEIGLSYSQWSITDICPFKTTLWLLDQSEIEGQKDAIRRVMPLLRCGAAKRNWLRCSDLFLAVSMRLELPFFGDHCVSATDNIHVPNIAERTAFSLVGKGQFASQASYDRGLATTTLENLSVRRSQVAMFFKLMSMCNFDQHSRMHVVEMEFAFMELVVAAQEQSFAKHFVTWTDKGPWYHYEDNITTLFRALVSPEVFQGLIVPLIESMKSLCLANVPVENSSTLIAQATVYLGLLQFHFSLPSSSEDPGERPLGSLLLGEGKLDHLASELAALEVYNFSQSGTCMKRRREVLLDDCDDILRNQEVDKMNVVERPSGSPHFGSLFLATTNFASSHASVEHVLLLLRNLTSCAKNGANEAMNWKTSAESFCDRLLEEFGTYSDVVAPIVASVGRICNGISHFVASALNQRTCHVSLQARSLLKFPQPNDCVVEDKAPQHTKLSQETAQLFGMAALSDLLLRKRLVGLDAHSLARWHNVVYRVLDPEAIGSLLTTGDIPASPDFEDDLKTQFPDYHGEFVTAEQTMENDVSSHPSGTDEERLQALSPSFLVERLCAIHSSVFLDEEIPTEADRLLQFKSKYIAARSLHFSNDIDSDEDCEFGPAHAMALAMVSSKGGLAQDESRSSVATLDLYNDSSPQRVQEASLPLTRLYARTLWLLSTFPGNAILLDVARVVDKVLKLDVDVTPVGKYMTGLDVVLKHAQDWEQHSSKRFSLGEDLDAIQRLASSWRKLEMESWSQLLQSREDKKLKNGSGQWARLHHILQQLQCEAIGSAGEHVQLTAVPSWVWTDCSFNYPEMSSSNDLTRDVIQAVESFCRTACIGGVDGRLRILQAFAHQIDAELAAGDCKVITLHLARSIKAIVAYYSQFSTFLSGIRASSKSLFIEQLEKETKLAKWDDRTYYAALESNQRNRRKVVGILREYEQSLDRAVSVFYEEELCRGIRPNLTSKAEAAATTPTAQSMFPFLESDDSRWQKGTSRPFHSTPIELLDMSSSLGLSSVQFPKLQTANLRRYTEKILKLGKLGVTKQSQNGETSSAGFRENILERLSYLRSPKASRQMKERALTDLFKKLRSEGFCSSTLHLPAQVHQARDLFELPLPNYQYMNPESDAELFYQRYLAETISFQQEVDTIGSDFMTKAQLDKMTATVKHGLFILVQQRCALHGVIRNLETLSSVRVEFARLSTPSWNQAKMQTKMKGFIENFLYAEESLKQQILFLKTCKALVAGEENLKFVHATCGQLDEFVLTLESKAVKQMLSLSLVSESDVHCAERKLEQLRRIDDFLRATRKGLVATRCLPSTSFDNCILSIEVAIASGARLSILEEKAEEPTDSSHCSSTPLENFLACASRVVEATLLAVQGLTKEVRLEKAENAPILLNHRAETSLLVSSDLSGLATKLSQMKAELTTVCSASSSTRCPYGAVVVNTGVVVGTYLDLTTKKVEGYLKFHTQILRLQYVLVRIFRVLTATGFCSGSDNETTERDTSEMTFEDDAEGTGMGEGEGKQDVTDQIENEEQLLGLKDDEKNEKAESTKDSKKLDKEEAETGMEMEAEFDGELHDVPEQDGNEEGENDENKEELDREMGNEPDGQDEVLDEKLWDESDAEDENDAAEGLEENSKVKDGDKSGEMTTKDQTEEEEEEQNQELGLSLEVENRQNEDVDENDTKEKINEELYEENNNVDVQERGREDDEWEQSNDPMDLDDNMFIDEDDSEASENAEEADEDDAMASVNTEVAPEEMMIDPSDDSEGEEEEGPNRENDSEIEIGPPNEENDILDEKDETKSNTEPPNNEESQQGLGVSDMTGNDAVDGDGAGQDSCEIEDTVTEAEESNVDPGEGTRDESRQPQDAGGNSQEGLAGQFSEMESTQQSSTEQAPNPLTNPTAAVDFWRQKVNILAGDEDTEGPQENSREPDNLQGDHELANDSELHALAECDNLGNMTDMDHGELHEPEAEVSKQEPIGNSSYEDRQKRRTPEQRDKTMPQETEAHSDNELSGDNVEDASTIEIDEIQADTDSERMSDEEETRNIVVSNIEGLLTAEGTNSYKNVVSGDEVEVINAEEEARAREKWVAIQGETFSLSRRLCESLRLVIEPLVASKLRGDYRTGKRINMKRVISYIASGYRKDKIWLRRTKPAKRNYRVLLAVDDSQSMQKSGAGEVALRAMSLISTAMSQLEIGEVGIASFGNEMKLVHPFQSVFAPSSGVSVVREFRFNQQRTRTALCIESALLAMEENAGDFASMQLFFMISDGRIERDSRADIRRLVREMVERNILLVLIIVEGDEKNSISSMKEVSFEKGKPVVKRFMDDYPFPYFIIVNDMSSLPEILADSLRQWFEILARLQGTEN